MAENSNIEWTTHTFNPWWGCTKVSAGCDHCYAETLSNRYGDDVWGHGKDRKTMSNANWAKPVKWNKDAEGAAERPRVFCASMADVFDNEAPAGQRLRLLRLIMETPNLDWLILTKRPGYIRAALRECAEDFECGAPLHAWIYEWLGGNPPANVWLGTSIENDKVLSRIDDLKKTPTVVHFLSVEPLIGPIDHMDLTHIEWVIIGGESGPGARPMHPDWARRVRDLSVEARVPVLFKQWGEWVSTYDIDHSIWNSQTEQQRGSRDSVNTSVGFFGNTYTMYRFGKKASGRELDGREWNEYPEVTR